MAKVKLYGVQALNFDSKDKQHIEGIKLHYGCFNQNVYGEKVDTKFFNSYVCTKLGLNYSELCTWVGKEVDFDVDLSGAVIGIRLADSVKDTSKDSSVKDTSDDYPY